ncbi:uncharacterized protein LOC132861140 [Tachysurus vachellii]|uniref:uncharacterized protein LOC132861140 n=1 Tax=Tachysurus vachellii TaxID=175792 RepID=UPI00296AA7E5|nr:uncharacterized protein LOC132861140 [Tachysurus vachellii]
MVLSIKCSLFDCCHGNSTTRAQERVSRMSKSKRCNVRPMHQTTLCLGDQTPCYSTTHSQSFCGRRDDGQPLVFLLRDPCYPSQHHCSLHLRNISEGISSFSSTHSRDVHSLKDVTPPDVLRSLRTRNWTRNCEGLAMKEVTTPPEETVYSSLYRSDYCAAETSARCQQASGRPSDWHRHNILTGEESAPAGPPREPKRNRVEMEIFPARRWDSDCTSLRLY